MNEVFACTLTFARRQLVLRSDLFRARNLVNARWFAFRFGFPGHDNHRDLLTAGATTTEDSHMR